MGSLLLEFSVESKDCPVVALTKAFPEAELEYLDMAVLDGDRFLEVFEVRAPDVAGFTEAMQKAGKMWDVDVLERHPDRVVAQVKVPVECVRTKIARKGCIPVQVRGQRGREIIAVTVRTPREAQCLVESLREEDASFRLEAIRPVGTLQHQSRWDLEGFGLTDKQEEVLRAALHGGYFDPARRKTGVDLAATLGVDRSTFSRHLRAGLRKVLTTLVRD